MRADNRGEGGILALMSLIGANGFKPGFKILTAMGLLGAALIYGDGVITPAISVLSALEGVNVASDGFKPYVMPMAVLILVALFATQRFGTEKIGRAFGPIMLALVPRDRACSACLPSCAIPRCSRRSIRLMGCAS